jgi:hypothetical protein
VSEYNVSRCERLGEIDKFFSIGVSAKMKAFYLGPEY